MKCPKCATIIPDDSMFCTFCHWTEAEADPLINSRNFAVAATLATPSDNVGFRGLWDWGFTYLLAPRWIMNGYKTAVIIHALVAILIVAIGIYVLVTAPGLVKGFSLLIFLFAWCNFIVAVCLSRWSAEASLIFFKIYDVLVDNRKIDRH